MKQNPSIKLIPSVFKSINQDGDFAWMIKQPKYKDALFIFNDNEEAFKEQSCEIGGGNANIRPYQCKNPPRSTGISTGNYTPGRINAGYTSLQDGDAKKIIDQGIMKVKKLLDTGRYKSVYFSSDGNGGLGTGIFKVGDDVKNYIVSELKNTVL